MARRSDRLDEFVRQATKPSDDQAAMLVDPSTRQTVLEEINRMRSYESPTTPRPDVRRRVLLAAAALVVLAAAALVSTKLLVTSGQGPVAVQPSGSAQTDRSGDIFAGVGFSCVEQYSPQSLAHRGFAFAGTVTTIGQRSASSDETDPYVPVMFTVATWFRGGQGSAVTVWMLPPDAVTSVGNTPYAVGSQLLVSGERRGAGAQPDDLLAWACGFTRWYTPTDATEWEQAFR